MQDKVKVKAALRAAGVAVEADTEWSDFLAALEAPDIQERLKCAPSTCGSPLPLCVVAAPGCHMPRKAPGASVVVGGT